MNKSSMKFILDASIDVDPTEIWCGIIFHKPENDWKNCINC